MNYWIFIIFLGTAVVSVGGIGFDADFDELKITNDKLDEVNAHSRRIDDFITRWGYYYTYCMPKIERIMEIIGGEKDHDEYSDTFIIDDWVVAELETFNGYLDWVVETTTMDSNV